MKILPLFDLEKVLFLPYIPYKFGQEIEIRRVRVVGSLNVHFGSFDFSASFHPLTAPKKWFYGRVFLFFKFVPHITPLQIELGS